MSLFDGILVYPKFLTEQLGQESTVPALSKTQGGR